MVNLYIVGAGGFGRELYEWIHDLPDAGRDWRFSGFLDDNPDALGKISLPPGVVGSIENHRVLPNDRFVCAIGLPKIKKRVVESLLKRGAQFLTVVHPSAILGSRIHIGTGVVICPGVILTTDINLGDFVMFNCSSSAGHDVEVGPWSSISGHCDLTGFVKLGEGVFCGSGARVIPGKHVGAGAVLGAGTVVYANIPANVTVVGVPARILKI